MRYYKGIKNGYIDYIGTNDGAGIDIDEEEYNILNEIISNKPADTETHYYLLNAETVQYEAIEREEALPTEEQLYTLDEAAAIIASEVAGNE